jgi:hypothetical protein
MDLRERAARTMCILLGEDPDEQSQGIAEPRWKAYLGIVDAVLSLPGLHDEAVREERERCMKAMCIWCRDDIPVTEIHSPYGQPRWMHLNPTDPQSQRGWKCDAAAIRAGQTKESA